MDTDPLSVSLFEMRLQEIYHKYSWLKYEITMPDFVVLFPVKYKNSKPIKPEQPTSFVVNRDIFLEVLVAFKQSFN